jgi:predicted Zn-dependent peptidase
VADDQAGLATLAATMLTSGAGGRTAFEFADAVSALGADISASAGWHEMVVRVRGLTSQFDSTLDLFADAILRPDLRTEDFDRERELALESIRARGQNPNAVAFLAGRAVVFGTDDPRGRPVDGFERTVDSIDLESLKRAVPTLVNPEAAQFVFVGDIDAETLKRSLEKHFGDWKSTSATSVELPAQLTSTSGRLVLVDRPDAPQTVIYMMRPVPAPDDDIERTSRRLVNTLFGWTFTSRLMRNLREEHGYTYGARSQFRQRGNQVQLYAFSAVQSDVTAAALGEFKKEFDGLATGDVTPDELSKASSTVRYELTNTAETTSSLAQTLIGLASDRRPMDSVARGLASLDQVDLDRVNETARSGLFSWENFVIVLVGDAATVKPQLEEAGFPTPQLVDMEGRSIEP